MLGKQPKHRRHTERAGLGAVEAGSYGSSHDDWRQSPGLGGFRLKNNKVGVVHQASVGSSLSVMGYRASSIKRDMTNVKRHSGGASRSPSETSSLRLIGEQQDTCEATRTSIRVPEVLSASTKPKEGAFFEAAGGEPDSPPLFVDRLVDRKSVV